MNDPKQFNDDPEKLVREMALASFVIYLLTRQFDWQLNTESYGFRFGSGTALMPGSNSVECTNLTGEELREKLRTTGNRFATSSIFSNFKLCLPPLSTIDIEAGSITLKNQFCELSFKLDRTLRILMFDPKTNVANQPILPDKKPRFYTIDFAIRMTTKIKWVRRQHRDLQKYQDWSKRVTEGAQRWFQTVPFQPESGTPTVRPFN